MAAKLRGFTLLEAVVGMVALAIVMTLLSTLLFPLAEDASASFQRAKAAQVGRGVLAELNGRVFDIGTPQGGGAVANIQCCADNGSLCPGSNSAPSQWQLLDNFHGFDESADVLLGSGHYQQFNVNIEVNCQRSLGWNGNAKEMAVTVTTPSGEQIRFSQLRGNY